MSRRVEPGTIGSSDGEREGRTRYMLDANAFDYILDRRIDPTSVRRLGDIRITSIQHGELLNVPDPLRRRRLLRVLSGIDPTVMPAPARARSDDSRGDERDGASAGTARRHRGASRAPRRWKDATIGEVAHLEGCVLVTDDKGFRDEAAGLGVPVLSCAEAFSDLDVLPGVPGTSDDDVGARADATRPSP